ncbi:MAG TPA: DinB family protein [Candidatus Binatia bacterium]
MNDLRHYFHAQACNNAWSNLRLLRACAGLDDTEFAAPRTGFFPSLKDTLNHIVTVDWLYADALERAAHGRPVNSAAARFFEPPSPFATCAALAPAQREVDRRLVALCAGLTDLSWTVSIQRDDHVQREPLVCVLAHLFQHQIHHRGQAHAMLAGTAVKPPQLDEFFLAEEAPLRAEELAVLGLREDEIWSD